MRPDGSTTTSSPALRLDHRVDPLLLSYKRPRLGEHFGERLVLPLVKALAKSGRRQHQHVRPAQSHRQRVADR